VARDSGKDYSLKDGEKISISIPGLTKNASDSTAQKSLISTSAMSSGGGLKKLAPPPGAKKSTAPVGLGFGAPVT
jgi:hypothetical protein